MAFDFDLAPFTAQHAFAVDQESTALNADDLSTVHVFLADDVELAAEFFIGIGQQVKRERLLLTEAFVHAHAVAGHTEYRRIAFLELGVSIAEILAFEGTAGGVVLGVKIQNQVLAL